jgi:membrane associated rhomboid family serine protease
MFVVIGCYILMTLPMLALYVVLGLEWTQRPRSYKFIRFVLVFIAALTIAFPGGQFVYGVAPQHAFPAAIFGLCSGLIVGYLRARKYD